MINWAHIDEDGEIISWGSSTWDDVFRQDLPEGLSIVGRPENVTGFENWRYVNSIWVQGF